MNSSTPRPEDGQEDARTPVAPHQPATVPLNEPAPGLPADPPGAAPEAAPAPGAPKWAYPPQPPEQRGARVGTVVWGLLIMTLAGLLIIARLGLVALDGGYVLIGLMLGTGAALVIGGLTSAASRKRRRRPEDDGAAPGRGSGDHVTKQA